MLHQSKLLKGQLLDVLTRDIASFSDLPGAETAETKHGPMIFIPGGGDPDNRVLAVGHLDWVMFEPYPRIKSWGQKNARVLNTPQLDDRLGVFVILHLLKLLRPDFKFDILLCDSEETANSTAQYFRANHPEKAYNWGFEFDRAGTDSVTYDYSSTEWDDEIGSFSDVGWGSFSDICDLQDLGCKFVNVGVGYHKQHTKHCYANLGQTLMMAKAFLSWADTLESERKFPHTKVVGNSYSWWTNSKYNTDNPTVVNTAESFYSGLSYDERKNLRRGSGIIKPNWYRDGLDQPGDADPSNGYDDDDYTPQVDAMRMCGWCDKVTDQAILCEDCQSQVINNSGTLAF